MSTHFVARGWLATLIVVSALSFASLALADPPFSYPQPGHAFAFPRDHGSHPDFKIEWWYVTGHLWADAAPARRFGFQATFFRQAGAHPGAPESEPAGDFAPAPFYLAHMALLDVSTGKFIFQERLNRSGWDASSSVTTLDVRNGNWTLRLPEAGAARMDLTGSIRSEALFQLALIPAQPLVFFGQDGVSRKGADPHAASYYLTFPRLAAEGTLRLGTETLPVHGHAWMDHEISSSQLAPDQIGWDWAALQLNDGRELMAYRMRLAGGATDRFSTLAWIVPGSPPRHFDPAQFTWEPHVSWKSPRTGAIYPNDVLITAPGLDPANPRETFHLIPLARDQELAGHLGGVTYWEGACRVENTRGEEIGSAFLELTGYADPLTGVR